MHGFVLIFQTFHDPVLQCVTLCYSGWPFISLYDYVWLCKTQLDIVWLCMTLYYSKWMNQFHKNWPFFYSGLLYLTLFDHIFCCCSVWLCFFSVLLKLILLNHVWTGLTVSDSLLTFSIVWFLAFNSIQLCLNLLGYIQLCLTLFNSRSYAQILCLFFVVHVVIVVNVDRRNLLLKFC